MHHPIKVKIIRAYFTLFSRIFPKWACISAYTLFHYPVNPKRKNRDARTLPEPNVFTVKLDDRRILQGYRWGEVTSPAVLLVHGWSTNPESMSHFISVLLSEGYQVLSYDALRHGKSSNTFADLADWADSVHAVIDTVGPLECIIAHSFGGAAVTVASKLDLTTKKLVLLAPIHDITSVITDFSERLGIPRDIVVRMQRYTWGKNKKNFTKYGSDWKDIVKSDFHIPTLILHDVDDKEIGIKHSEELCKIWPWATLIPTHDLGHRKILDDPFVVKQTVAFIQDVQQ